MVMFLGYSGMDLGHPLLGNDQIAGCLIPVEHHTVGKGRLPVVVPAQTPIDSELLADFERIVNEEAPLFVGVPAVVKRVKPVGCEGNPEQEVRPSVSAE
jgi:hypothetical protein